MFSVIVVVVAIITTIIIYSFSQSSEVKLIYR